MNPGTYAMRLRRNAATAVRLELFAKDSDGAEVPMDLSGYSLKMDIRLYPGQPGEPLLSLSNYGGPIDITEPEAGAVEIDWQLIQTQIAALPSVAEAGDPTQPRVDTFAYDLLLIASDGSAQAILEGTVPVSFGVTQNG